MGLIFPFSHNPVLWRNAGLSQLCVLSRPSCVDLTRQSQTCWRQPPDVIHSPRRALPSLADGPPSPVHHQRGEKQRRSEIRLADRACRSPTWIYAPTLLSSSLQLHSVKFRGKPSQIRGNLCNDEHANTAWRRISSWKVTGKQCSVATITKARPDPNLTLHRPVMCFLYSS